MQSARDEERSTKEMHQTLSCPFKKQTHEEHNQRNLPYGGHRNCAGSADSQLISSHEEMAEQTAQYYESLMSTKTSEATARESLLTLFCENGQYAREWLTKGLETGSSEPARPKDSNSDKIAIRKRDKMREDSWP